MRFRGKICHQSDKLMDSAQPVVMSDFQKKNFYIKLIKR